MNLADFSYSPVTAFRSENDTEVSATFNLYRTPSMAQARFSIAIFKGKGKPIASIPLNPIQIQTIINVWKTFKKSPTAGEHYTLKFQDWIFDKEAKKKVKKVVGVITVGLTKEKGEAYFALHTGNKEVFQFLLPNANNSVEANLNESVRRLIAIDNFLSLLYTARDIIYQSRSIPAVKDTHTDSKSSSSYDNVEDEIPY